MKGPQLLYILLLHKEQYINSRPISASESLTLTFLTIYGFSQLKIYYHRPPGEEYNTWVLAQQMRKVRVIWDRSSSTAIYALQMITLGGHLWHIASSVTVLFLKTEIHSICVSVQSLNLGISDTIVKKKLLRFQNKLSILLHLEYVIMAHCAEYLGKSLLQWKRGRIFFCVAQLRKPQNNASEF